MEVSGGRVEISVPAGTSHDLWTNRNHAPRLLQAAPDSDLEVVAKFDSVVDAKYQSQGLLAVQDFDDLLRVDVFYTGSSTQVFAARMDAGTATTLLNKTIAGGAPVWLGLARTGDTWSVSHSYDGTSWTDTGSFTYPLTVSQVGLFAGNHTPSPAFTAQIDYFLNPADPLDPEPEPEPDVTPPVISGVAATPTTDTATIDWTTDEPATGAVAYGTTTTYQDGTVSDNTLTTSHSLTLDGLTCETIYHYQITTTDQAGNTTTTPDATFTTTTCPDPDPAPVIDVWYGLHQRFGHLANSQAWITIPGTATSNQGIDAVSYQLNGGPPQGLTIGPDGKRLADAGDFIIELDRSALPAGDNEVLITAIDSSGVSATVTVTVEHTTGQTGSLPFAVDWSTSSNLLDAVEPMEGRWSVDGGMARPTQFGYDRLVALGDITWTDYEVTVPITLHTIDPIGDGYQSPSNGPALGLGVRWSGHSGTKQPRQDYFPAGAFAWYRWRSTSQRFELIGNESKYVDRAPGTYNFLEGQTFMHKVRVHTGADGRATYQFKAWEASTAEPADWLLEITTDATDPDGGSIVLIAHEVDASFGNVTVTPVP
ncbi:MAG TPA: hypothetical protein VMS99_06945 [Acidimicrobiia bacterium]|nr:hypothetical protein [Acidimicrobiia bacterium]